jgi:hypothetical protein
VRFMKLGDAKAARCAYFRNMRTLMESGMSDMEKFLTPESMLTPGLAGGMTMGITNALAFQFGLIAPGPAVIALVLSFLFGLCVFVSSQKSARVVKLLFWVINSLVIFTVAAGSNALGTAATTAQTAPAHQLASRLVEMLVATAHAQEMKWCCVNGSVVLVSAYACAQNKGQVAQSRAQANQMCTPPASAKPEDKSADKPPFFRPWIATK